MRSSSFDRKAQILSEATKLFSEFGYDKVTIKMLADACGITEPALYRHYVSKDAIYDSVLDSIEKRLHDTQEVFDKLAVHRDIEKLLKEFAQHIISYFSKNEDLYRLLLFAALRDHNKAKRVYQSVRGRYVRFLIQQLDTFFEEGLIIEKNNDITARCFTGMVFDCALGITLWRGMQGKIFKPEDVVANNIPIYARGLVK